MSLLRPALVVPTLLVFLSALACGGGANDSSPAVQPAEQPASQPATAGQPGVVPKRVEPVVVLAAEKLAPLPTISVPVGSSLTSEIEPNNERATATALSGKGADGQLGTDDEDWYVLTIDRAGLWAATLRGGPIKRATLHNAGAKVATFRKDGDERMLQAVYLTPGTYWVQVEGKPGTPYQLHTQLIDATEGVEHEPNDDAGHTQRLAIGGTRRGWLTPKGDKDFYRFSLEQRAYVQLSFATKGTGTAKVVDQHTTRTVASGLSMSDRPWQGWLGAGDYQVVLSAKDAQSEPYAVELALLDPFQRPTDLEPNDADELASPIAKTVVGELRVNDNDRYRFPLSPHDRPFSIRVVDGKPRIAFRAGTQRLTKDTDGTVRGVLPANTSGLLLLSGTPGPYALAVEMEGVKDPTGLPNARVSLPPTLGPLSAYRDHGQTLTVPLTLEGTGPLALEAWVSAEGWSIDLPDTVQLEGTRSLDLTLTAPPDASSLDPIVLTVAARQVPTGSAVSASTTVLVECGMPLQGTTRAWPLPDALLGGYNVAALAAGASTDNERKDAMLFDGLTPGDKIRRIDKDGSITVKLGGDRPEVRGIVLDPTGSRRFPVDVPFTLELSDDGSSWSPALQGIVERRSVEQPFVLDTPTRAQHARLRFPAGAVLGEFKVIGPSPAEPVQISDLAQGGRVVRTRPYMNYPTALIDGAPKTDRAYRVQAGQPLEFVLSFEHNRSARLGKLEWVQPAKTPGTLHTTASVSVSSRPIGPWTPVGELALGGAGETTSLDLNGTWARYVKVTSVEVIAERNGMLPDSLRVYEASRADGDFSIVGEYGKYSSRGPFELSHPLELPDEPDREKGKNDTLAIATPLTVGKRVSGDVTVGEDLDVYVLTVPADHNTLTLEGTSEARFVVSTADEQLPTTVTHEGDLTRWTTAVAPGSAVFVTIDEPPRNIGLLWDQSGSVGSYLPQIFSAVNTFVEGVQPGREVANLYPFQSKEGAFLSEEWSADPTVLHQSLNAYDRKDNSSDAEVAFLAAMRELESREGSRALLVLTDAATPKRRYVPMWDRFASVQPRVFTMELHIGNAATNQTRMQHWADVAEGHYTTFSSARDLDVAFHRASCLIRGPSRYAFTASTSSQAPPEPAQIRVEAAALEGFAVEIILDASGSMLQRVKGKARIDIAKDSLKKLLAETVPAKTPVALRVFGHREAGKCRTDLEVPLRPLEAGAMTRKLDSIRAKNLAKTPIGASLNAVVRDLAGHTGPQLVLLLTDGEETCDGDPEAAIEALQASGADVRMNIVGFAIDDAALKADFDTWSSSLGGVYLDAADEDELGQAMLAALAPRVQVLRAGDLIAEGTAGGEPMVVPPGSYTVKVLTSPPRSQVVEVTAGQVLTVK